MTLVLMFRFPIRDLADQASKRLFYGTVLRRSNIDGTHRSSDLEWTSFNVCLRGNPDDTFGIDTTDIAAVCVTMAMFQGQFAGTKEEL